MFDDCLPLDEQFKFFEPLFGKKSLTYKNGPEARKKRQLIDRSFSHQTVTHYYEHFTEVFYSNLLPIKIIFEEGHAPPPPPPQK